MFKAACHQRRALLSLHIHTNAWPRRCRCASQLRCLHFLDVLRGCRQARLSRGRAPTHSVVGAKPFLEMLRRRSCVATALFWTVPRWRWNGACWLVATTAFLRGKDPGTPQPMCKAVPWLCNRDSRSTAAVNRCPASHHSNETNL